MYAFRNTVLAVSAAVWWCCPAPAQTIPAKEAHVNSTPPLITVKSVQKELKMTEEQIKKVEQIPALVKKKIQAQLDSLDELEGRELREKSKEVRELYRKAFPKFLAEVLTKEQMARLKQISLQFLGAKAFIDPDVVKALDLTPEQQKTMQKIVDDTSKETFEIYLKATDDTKAARKKVDELNKKQMDAALNALSDQQKKAWKEVIKDPFEVKFDPLPPRPKKDPGKKGVKLSPELQEGLGWVAKKVEEWQPSTNERFFDKVGWADDIRQAIRLAKEHNRPVFLMNSTGNMPLGLC
jgi:hypothetical protein